MSDLIPNWLHLNEVVQTGRPDVFYARLTELAASGDLGAIHEVTSPDDNLQAVFQYLVKA